MLDHFRYQFTKPAMGSPSAPPPAASRFPMSRSIKARRISSSTKKALPEKGHGKMLEKKWGLLGS